MRDDPLLLLPPLLPPELGAGLEEGADGAGAGEYDGALLLDEPDDVLPARDEPLVLPELLEAGALEYP